MKILLLIFTLLFFTLTAYAQSVGFFIPQKTLEMMNRTERLPEIRTQPQPVVNPQANRPNNNSAASTPTIAQPQTPKVAAPKTQPVIPQQKTLANDTVRRKEAPKPRPADEPMVPQTGTPVIPVTADDVPADIQPDNTPTTPPQKPTTPQTETPTVPDIADEVASNNTPVVKESTQQLEPSAYEQILKEYEEDIRKISQNIPVANKRLDDMLKNYRDEVLILD